MNEDKANAKKSIRDMPKLESLFIRKTNDKDEYVCTPEINESCRWVFEEDENVVQATEKLDGTNVSIIIENGIITSMWNRTNRISFFCEGKEYIVEGIIESFKRGYLKLPDGQHFGELIGEKLNGNPYKIVGHLWIPFNTYCMKKLAYNSFHKYPKDYESLKKWFLSDIKDGGIFSLFMRRKGIEQKPEGIVFHNLKTGDMCKLRLDMFEDFKGNRHNNGFKKKV